MDSKKLASLINAFVESENNIMFHHIRLMALESVLATNFPKVSDQYHLELSKLLEDYEAKHPGFLPAPNVLK